MMPTVPPCRDSVRLLTCQGERLLAVLSEPVGIEPRELGIVIVVGGPQYRVGSHRQFTLLARELASAGWPTLRFDVRGMGDSEGEFPGFEALSDDIGTAIDDLTAARPELRGIVLWGLCDGASAALLYLYHRRDSRIVSLCLVNPWVRSDETLARTHVKHYYARRLMTREVWQRLATGQIQFRALTGLLHSVLLGWRRSTAIGHARVGQDDYRFRMADALRRNPLPTLLALSGNDFVAREFRETCEYIPAWAEVLRRLPHVTVDLPGADHTLSNRVDHDSLRLQLTLWLDEILALTENGKA